MKNIFIVLPLSILFIFNSCDPVEPSHDAVCPSELYILYEGECYCMARVYTTNPNQDSQRWYFSYNYECDELEPSDFNFTIFRGDLRAVLEADIVYDSFGGWHPDRQDFSYASTVSGLLDMEVTINHTHIEGSFTGELGNGKSISGTFRY